MPRFVSFFAGVLLVGGVSSSCLGDPVTLSDYIALGAEGVTIGDTTFSDFATFALPTGAMPISPDDVLVHQVDLPTGRGFEFVVNRNAGPGELFEILIGYNVTAATPLDGAQLSLTDSAATDDAAVTTVTDLFLGGIYDPTDPTNGTGIHETLVVFQIEGDSETLTELLFSRVGQIGVITDIAVDGGLSGTGALTSATNLFTPVPEPRALALVALGLIILGASRGRRS